MPKLERIKCPICGTEIEDELFVPCPYCEWGYTGIEKCFPEDEKSDFNFMSPKEAKAMVARGLTIFGAPLPNRPKVK